MCGIAGIKAEFGERDSALLKALGAMQSRGPDSLNHYSDRDIILGHLRLKIIDLSAQANQPMPNEDENLRLVFNGEIYNFRELRRQLESLGHTFRSQGDSEVILHGYEEWGADCLQFLRGMFAFAIWDKRRRELFLARDRIGIKPLYYYSKNKFFLFASQVRAILATGLSLRALSRDALASYMDSGGVGEPLTIIEGIYSLPPGHYLILGQDEPAIHKYWEISKTTCKSHYRDPREITEDLGMMLKDVMRLHLVSDVPLGIFLSGGIDSSSLLSLASEFSTRIKSVSLVFKEKRLNEGSYCKLAAERYGSEYKEVLIEENYLLGSLEKAIEAMDEPTFNGINTYFVSQAAKDAGLTVALSGLGGDELFGGYPSFRRINKLRLFCRVWDRLNPPARYMLGDLLRFFLPPSVKKEKIIELFKDGSTLSHPYFWLRRLFTAEERGRLLSRYGYAGSNKNPDLKELDIINQVSYLEMTNYMPDILLRDTDFMSMAHSLEVRVPFLDHKLVEFVFSIPGEFKMRGNTNKPLLTGSLGRSLPEVILKRQKMGFTLPFNYWLKGHLKDEVEETLREKESVLQEFIDQKEVLRIWDGFLKGHVSWQRPWAIYVLKSWVKLYLE